jgi:hypothetical protein
MSGRCSPSCVGIGRGSWWLVPRGVWGVVWGFATFTFLAWLSRFLFALYVLTGSGVCGVSPRGSISGGFYSLVFVVPFSRAFLLFLVVPWCFSGCGARDSLLRCWCVAPSGVLSVFLYCYFSLSLFIYIFCHSKKNWTTNIYKLFWPVFLKPT